MDGSSLSTQYKTEHLPTSSPLEPSSTEQFYNDWPIKCGWNLLGGLTVLGFCLTGPATGWWQSSLDLVEFHWPCCGIWLWFPKNLHRCIQLQLSGGHQRLCSGCWLGVHHPHPPPWHGTPHQPLHTRALLPYSAEVLLLAHIRCHISSLLLVKGNPGLKVPMLTSELINKSRITQAM